MHIAPNASEYNRYDTHNNYMDGVIVNPSLVVAGKVRTADGRWAVCHPPNGVNLKNGAYGIRWWVSRDEWPELDALWLDEEEEEDDSAPFLTLRRVGGLAHPGSVFVMDFHRDYLQCGNPVIRMRDRRVDPDGSIVQGIGNIYDADTFDEMVNQWTLGIDPIWAVGE